MQETIPPLEKDLDDFLNRFVDIQIRMRSPASGQVSRHCIFEGHNYAIVRASGEEDDTGIREFSAETQIDSDKLLYGNIDEILQCFLPAAEAMANDQEKALFETMQKASEEVGNVVDNKGQPLSFDALLAVTEKIQIDFDSDGKPKLPTIFIHPDVQPHLEKLMNSPEAKEFEGTQKKLIEKKRLEWREREANRTLVR